MAIGIFLISKSYGFSLSIFNFLSIKYVITAHIREKIHIMFKKIIGYLND